MRLNSPRPLTDAEQHVLRALLEPDFPGASALRAQVEHVEVVGTCDCGCPTVDLLVPLEVPASDVATRGRLAPVEGRVEQAGHAPGEIILFVDDGRLSSLEYVYYDNPPSSWPSPDQVRFVT